MVSTKTITLTIPHRHTQAEVRSRIQNAIASYRTQFAGKIADVHETWTGDRLDFHVAVMGQSVAGRIEVEAQQVRLQIDFPWLLAMLAGNITNQIEQEGRKLLE